MKKTFQIIGLISLTIFSFYLTDKTVLVVNNMDEIMIEIKNNKDSMKTNTIDANIDIENNTIIPGVRGRTVNINKSYKNMKEIGYYNDKYYIYDYINPNISLKNNKDKYIIKGNPSKRYVSLIFKVDNNDNIDEILNILNNYSAKSTFLVNDTWFTNNTDKISNMIKEGHNIIPFTTNNIVSYEWMDNVIKKINKQSVGFCYLIDNYDCIDDNYIIKSIDISSNTPLLDIKSKVESGSIFTLYPNTILKKELSSIIIYIASKGYKITNLEDNVLE